MSELSKDLLRGVRAIAKELGLTERAVYDHLERHIIPGAKFGRTWISSRSQLAKHFADRINGSMIDAKAEQAALSRVKLEAVEQAAKARMEAATRVKLEAIKEKQAALSARRAQLRASLDCPRLPSTGGDR